MWQLLADVPLAPDANIDALARATPTLSGSDLRELCRTAALRGMRGALAALPPGELAAHTEVLQPPFSFMLQAADRTQLVMRPLTLVDFVDALRNMLATRASHEGVDRQAWRGGNPFAARAPAEDRSRLDEEDEETVVDKVVEDVPEERVVELD
jgi:SpoVK/Ycf46/Vps4 family AAA+-type ATPase